MKTNRCAYAFTAVLIAGIFAAAFAMDLPEAKEKAISLNPSEGLEAIDALKTLSATDGLHLAITNSRNHKVRIAAIEALGEVGTSEDAEALLGRLDRSKYPVVEGGSEQKAKGRAAQEALVKSLSKLCGVEATTNLTVEGLTTFIDQCRGKLETPE